MGNEHGGIGHQSQHKAFTVQRQAAADTDIARHSFLLSGGDMAILRKAPISNVHAGHDLDTA